MPKKVTQGTRVIPAKDQQKSRPYTATKPPMSPSVKKVTRPTKVITSKQ